MVHDAAGTQLSRGRETEIARERACRDGIRLVVAAVSGPNSSVLPVAPVP